MTLTSTAVGVLVAALGIWGISIMFNAVDKLVNPGVRRRTRQRLS